MSTVVPSAPGRPRATSSSAWACGFPHAAAVLAHGRGRLVTATATGTAAASIGPGSSTGTGAVFVPNPVQSLGDESLTDQKDADAAVPAAAYHIVTLTNLDGSGHLSGDYATIVSETGNPAYSPTNTFRYTRHQDEFEQVMAYYWITEAQKYIHSHGGGIALGSVAPLALPPSHQVEPRRAGATPPPHTAGPGCRDGNS